MRAMTLLPLCVASVLPQPLRKRLTATIAPRRMKDSIAQHYVLAAFADSKISGVFTWLHKPNTSTFNIAQNVQF
jgi:hypothetical protein